MLKKENFVHNYHDVEIIGTFFEKEKKALKLFCEENREIVFDNIIQFEINFFSDQNIIFDIYLYAKKNIPDTLINDYPFLDNYKNGKIEVLCYYIESSVGLSGIIICSANNK